MAGSLFAFSGVAIFFEGGSPRVLTGFINVCSCVFAVRCNSNWSYICSSRVCLSNVRFVRQVKTGPWQNPLFYLWVLRRLGFFARAPGYYFRRGVWWFLEDANFFVALLMVGVTWDPDFIRGTDVCHQLQAVMLFILEHSGDKPIYCRLWLINLEALIAYRDPSFGGMTPFNIKWSVQKSAVEKD